MGAREAKILSRWQQFDPIKQIKPMKATFPGFRASVGRNRQVAWKGEFQPNPDSPIYTLTVRSFFAGFARM
jgi:hypothetical protein